ncbi:hypothetical protein ACI0FM_10190 [Paenochrobactrum sp. BZR 588]|uniref:hypothetical protein n=1 Tax=unclassified Paenochrobactrum TaxID=2639760 RepID=UPI00385262B4
MSKLAGFSLVLVLVSGCAGVDYTQKNYAGLPAIDYKTDDGRSYRIVENREQKKILIGPSIDPSASRGFVKGLALGSGIDPVSPVVVRDAAEAYLNSSNRRCESRDVTMIVDPYYEVRYICGFAVTRRNRGF